MPAMPHVRTQRIVLIGSATAGPLRELSDTRLFVYPALIGLGYLLSGEVGLSIWLFWLLTKL